MDVSLISNNERDLMKQALKQGLRVDGRKLKTARSLKINFEAEPGTVEVSLGKTKVLCSVSSELGMPSQYRPNEGKLSFDFHVANYIKIKKDEIDRILSIISNGIHESQCIDFESLCVLSGEKVWNLTVDINLIENDGNIVDCINIGVICSLKHHRRPDVSVVGSQITVHSMIDRHPIALKINCIPVCVTLGHIDISQVEDISGGKSNYNNNNDNINRSNRSNRNKNTFATIVDPSLKEEKILDGKTTYCMTKFKQLCAIDKIGGICYDNKEFISYIYEYIINIVKLWDNEIVNKFIQAKLDDARKRKQLLNAKIINPIDVFKPFKIKQETQEMKDNGNRNNEVSIGNNMNKHKNDNNNDNDNLNDNQMWDKWIMQEQKKFEIIQNNLTQQNDSVKEKRLNLNTSVLTSEFS